MDFDDLDDLDELIDRATDYRRPRLVELGRQKGARGARLYCWSNGRILAEVRGNTARIERHLGEVGELGSDGAWLGLDELRAIVRACRVWTKERTDWAAFFSVSAGYGAGGTEYYQPRGSQAQVREVGSVMMGHRRGKRLVGIDEIVPLDRPEQVAVGLTAVAELWRTGECVGPKKGALIGRRFALGDGLLFDARRESATIITPRDGEVVIEPDEPRFLRALVRLLAQDAA